MVLRDVCWLVLHGTFFPGLQQASTEFLNLPTSPRPACWLCLSAPAEFADRLCATGGAEVQNQQWNSCVSCC